MLNIYTLKGYVYHLCNEILCDMIVADLFQRLVQTSGANIYVICLYKRLVGESRLAARLLKAGVFAGSVGRRWWPSSRCRAWAWAQ